MNELESSINKVNISLKKDNKALIIKKEVPIQLTAKGLVASMSTVDYTGIVNGGKFIAFEAKETLSKTSIPLSNIKQHQVNYLNLIKALGGISFFIVHFKKVYKDKVFIVPSEFIDKHYNSEGRKSIPIKDFNLDWLTDINSYLSKALEIIT